MKKLICFLLLLFACWRIDANPLPVSDMGISELAAYINIVEDTIWELELHSNNVLISDYTYDSILISTSSGTGKIENFTVSPGEEYLILTKDSFNTELNIDPNGDTITLLFNENTQKRVLIFGDCPGAFVGKPGIGESIANPYSDDYNSSFFSKDKSLTLGEPNDSAGMCGTITGKIYKINSNPAGERNFRIDFPFTTSASGDYSARVYSCPQSINWVDNIVNNASHYIDITPLNFIMEPDSVIELDIYLLDTLISGIQPLLSDSDFPVKLYPNPVNIGQGLYYEISLPVIASSCTFELVDMSGKVLSSIEIHESTGILELPSQTYEGIYVLNVRWNNKMVYSARIILNRQ